MILTGWMLWMACSPSDRVIPMEGTTARIDEKYELDGNESELDLIVMSNREQCQEAVGYESRAANKNLYEIQMQQCLPWIDRGVGELKLSVRFELDGQNFPLSLTSEDIQVIHDQEQFEVDPPTYDLRVQPHNPVRIKQLFILMIDGSASMNTIDSGSSVTRMDKVRQALKMRSVKEAFFPNDVNNHVVIYTFTEGTPRPLGGRLTILDNPSDYAALIDANLQAQSGFTFLYDSIEYGMKNVLKDPRVSSLLDGETQPTLVVLTDGYNNEKNGETCSSNVDRLQTLLDSISKEVQVRSPETPTIFTVGLGKPLDKDFSVDDLNDQKLRPRHLCGKYSPRSFIDAQGDQTGLEDISIDNVSLDLIAARGNGRSFVKKNARGLGQAFAEVAAVRHQWFEIQYRHNALKMRKSFETRFKLLKYARAMSSTNIYPHAWLDGPPGLRDSEGWSKRGSYWHSTTILTSGLGLLIFLSILGAAVFNVKRMLLGRLTPPSAKKYDKV